VAYTRLQVRNQIKQRCNLENTSAQQNSEIDTHINDAASYTHDFLIGAWGERYSRQATVFPTVAGTALYTLAATNFYKPIRVVATFDNVLYPLKPYSIMEKIVSMTPRSWDPRWLPEYALNIAAADGTNKIEFYPFPDTVYVVAIEFHPTAPTYSLDADLIKIPHVDLLVMEACIRVKDKDERESSRFMQERALIQKRIEDWVGSADLGNVDGTLRTGRFGTRRGALPDGRLF
jgi:hypothetical protein